MTDTRSSRREVLKAASVIAAAAPVVRLAGAPTTARAATPAAGQKAALATIDTAFRAAVDAKKVAGVVAIAATDKGVIYEGAIGRRDMDKGPDMTPDTLFWIASMTKAVTGTACMQLVEQGKLKLDDPVGELLPDLAKPQILEGFDASGQPRLRPATKPITLRHLMTHTAGFVYSIWSEPMLQYEKVTGSPFVGTLQDGVAESAFDVRARRALGVRHQHRLGRQGGRGGQRPVARDLFPREHLRAARDDGHRLPHPHAAEGPRRHHVPARRGRCPQPDPVPDAAGTRVLHGRRCPLQHARATTCSSCRCSCTRARSTVPGS